jgi:hypothetical protein
MRLQEMRRWDREVWLVAAAASLASFSAFFVYLLRGQLLLYGDAVAHINIARRVFDSRTPGLLQLGTVWLPLPHLLLIPFVAPRAWWQTGVGAAIPSMAAYVLATVGIFRLVREALSAFSMPDGESRLAAWIAALIFAANPNLLYLQATAMTEPLYLAFFVWSLVFLSQFVRELTRPEERFQIAASASLRKCGLCVMGAALTRYDGWFLAIFVAAVAYLAGSRTTLRIQRSLRAFVMLVGTAPALWMIYNWAVYHDPLEFSRGPYSARAIATRSFTPEFRSYPGEDAPGTAALYFLKAAGSNLATGSWDQIWLGIAAISSLAILLFGRSLLALLLLWLPLPFYVFSVAYGSVPIYVPEWWPFSYYNIRYGIQLLPAIAVSLALAGFFAVGFARSAAAKALVFAGILLLAVASYLSVWRASPICLREAWLNSQSRIALERAVGHEIMGLPENSILLMYLGDHGGALQYAGIPLRRAISEGNHRPWKQPRDPEGLWERALADPAAYADFAVAGDGDPVGLAMQDRGASAVAEIRVQGQRPVVIYALRPVHPPH